MPQLYPIIVAVSVITIFTTPYFIKMADPAYRMLEPRLPSNLRFLINRYNKEAEADTDDSKKIWNKILKRYLWRILLYSVILVAIISVTHLLLYPVMEALLGRVGHLLCTVITLVLMSPFLVALAFSRIESRESRQENGEGDTGRNIPIVAMKILRYIMALLFLVYFFDLYYPPMVAWLVGIGCFFLILGFASTSIYKRYKEMEKRFVDNLNIRENVRYGVNNNIIDDLHQAFIEVGPSTGFVGDRLKDSGLRRDYGVSISSIQRGHELIPLPSGNARIFPGDIIGVIGTDEQIKKLNDDIELEKNAFTAREVTRPEVDLKSIRLTSRSPIVGVALKDTDIRGQYYSMLVKVLRGDDFIQPVPSLVLKPDDVVWVVGDPKQFAAIKGDKKRVDDNDDNNKQP